MSGQAGLAMLCACACACACLGDTQLPHFVRSYSFVRLWGVAFRFSLCVRVFFSFAPRPYYCNANLYRIVAILPVLALLGLATILDLFVLDACEDIGAGLDIALVRPSVLPSVRASFRACACGTKRVRAPALKAACNEAPVQCDNNATSHTLLRTSSRENTRARSPALTHTHTRARAHRALF